MTNQFLQNKFYQGKRVLITGHTGFKGAWLSLLLNKMGAEVFGYALKPPTKPSLYDLIEGDAFVKSSISDISDYDKLKSFIVETKPEIIIHMAAQSLVKTSYTDPLLTYQTNIMGTVNLLEATRIAGKTKVILNVTTDKCYENKEWERGYHENDRLGGHDPYSNSKACSELITASYRKSFYEKENKTILATARSGNIIGGGDWSQNRLIPDFVRSMQTKQEVIIRNPKSTRPWQYILDSLFGYLFLIEKLYVEGSSYGEGWNFGPGEESHKTVEWIIAQLCQMWGENATYRINRNQNVHEANFLKLDSSKAKDRLKWSNSYSLKKGLHETADWYRRYLNGENPREISISQIDKFIKSY